MIPDPLEPSEPREKSPLIYGNRPQRIRRTRHSPSRYADDVWYLASLELKEHQRGLSMRFDSLPPALTPMCKDLIFALLTAEPPSGEQLLSASTIRKHFSYLKEFSEFLNGRGITRANEIGLNDLEAYAVLQLQTRLRTQDAYFRRMRSVRLLYLYRDEMPQGGLRYDPYKLPFWAELGRLSPRRGENATERIPESTLIPLLLWATRWVNELSSDVLNANDEFLRLRAWGPANEATKMTSTEEGWSRMKSLLESYEREGRPLPGAKSRPPNCSSPVNLAHLAREAQCKMDVVQRIAPARIQAAMRRVGIDDDAYLRLEPAALIDKQVWLRRISYREVPQLLTLLTSACYIVIAFYSGMRDSEIKHLRKGCLRTITDDFEVPNRHIVTSLAFKGETAASGVEATWVVGEDVVKAVHILEEIQPATDAYLFAPSRLPLAGRRLHDIRGHGAMTANHTNRELNRFVDWVIDYSNSRGIGEKIPIINGRPWKLTTQQFRRTLAWFIARRPGGSIAGAIQFRHRSIQMFEGYAGTSLSGFRPEVEGELAMARGDYLLEHADAYPHPNFTGPAATEADRRVANFAERVRFEGIVADNARQMRDLISSNEPNVYPSESVTCVFNPEKALCLRSSGAVAPDLQHCQPMACKNVALDEENRAFWEERLREAATLLENSDALNPYSETMVRESQLKIRRLLGR